MRSWPVASKASIYPPNSPHPQSPSSQTTHNSPQLHNLPKMDNISPKVIIPIATFNNKQSLLAGAIVSKHNINNSFNNNQ